MISQLLSAPGTPFPFSSIHSFATKPHQPKASSQPIPAVKCLEIHGYNGGVKSDAQSAF
jgi:hypothetical protein